MLNLCLSLYNVLFYIFTLKIWWLDQTPYILNFDTNKCNCKYCGSFVIFTASLRVFFLHEYIDRSICVKNKIKYIRFIFYKPSLYRHKYVSTGWSMSHFSSVTGISLLLKATVDWNLGYSPSTVCKITWSGMETCFVRVVINLQSGPFV